jgi:hypothetical protein
MRPSFFMKTFQLAVRPAVFLVCTLISSDIFADSALESGVRGVATRAPKEMKIDGDLSEFKSAFSTPAEYFHPTSNKKDPNSVVHDRAAQFLYMWDEEAF